MQRAIQLVRRDRGRASMTMRCDMMDALGVVFEVCNSIGDLMMVQAVADITPANQSHCSSAFLIALRGNVSDNKSRNPLGLPFDHISSQ